jgi:hypothetical protein
MIVGTFSVHLHLRGIRLGPTMSFKLRMVHTSAGTLPHHYIIYCRRIEYALPNTNEANVVPDVAVQRAFYLGDEIARLISGLFCASSKRRTMTSHLVVLQMCFDPPLIASENNVRPAACSTASTDAVAVRHVQLDNGRRRDLLGYTKLSKGASSGMTAFGSTNAPVETSGTWGVEGDDGRDARTTFAKCVGTATFGGLPITSYVLVYGGE